MCAVASSPVWVRFDPGRTEPVCFKESTSIESSFCISVCIVCGGESATLWMLYPSPQVEEEEERQSFLL